jgi:hypothetical protein
MAGGSNYYWHGKEKILMDGMEELPVQMHNLMHIVHKVGGCKFVLEEFFFLSCAILFRICFTYKAI